MKRITLIICMIIITFSFTLFAQSDKDKDKVNSKSVVSCPGIEGLEEIANSSPAAKSLNTTLSNSDLKSRYESLKEVVRNKDITVIPLLKARLACNLGPTERHLEVALVGLGETEYFDKTIQELKSRDNVVVYYAIWKLARFKTKEAYKKLYELLDDHSIRENEKRGDDGGPVSLATNAKRQLARTVENPPKNTNDTEAWKKWFKENNLISCSLRIPKDGINFN